MDKATVKDYINNVSTFIERFAAARMVQLGADQSMLADLAEDIHMNVMQKDPSPIRHWSGLDVSSKKKLAECILMLKEMKHEMLSKENESFIDGLNEFVTGASKSIEEAIDDEDALISALKEAASKIQTFSQVKSIHKSLLEAQEQGDEETLVDLKSKLDELTK